MKQQHTLIFLFLFPALALCEPAAPAPKADANQNKVGLLEAREAQRKAAFVAQQKKNILATSRRNLRKSVRSGDPEAAAFWAAQIKSIETGVPAVVPAVPKQPIEPDDKFTPNGYGLGVNRDQFGAAHVYRTKDGKKLDPVFQGSVKRNAYGFGVHADKFGRVVYDSTP